MMLEIKKEDFDEVLPTKMSVARLFGDRCKIISKIQHKQTHEQIYEQIEDAHIRIFGNRPFKSFESFKKYKNKHRKEI